MWRNEGVAKKEVEVAMLTSIWLAVDKYAKAGKKTLSPCRSFWDPSVAGWKYRTRSCCKISESLRRLEIISLANPCSERRRKCEE